MLRKTPLCGVLRLWTFGLYCKRDFVIGQYLIVSNYSRRLHSHKTLVLELAADGYNLTQDFTLKGCLTSFWGNKICFLVLVV